ncbi:MAG: tRNA (N(6)-L-threonylcarbamoyladenosine(37)-C(2))-methylthiotransferase MtaB [Omnitrophica bacterium RIFCSPLOWO2_12_FULL_44_17]|uniref:tRNA (N(6)-L-threonylcarbamoyladenosine(37)-C(2))-methylthiotransferase n=1 Tax=Candidatus Danuiimicrobium aquiferis TaxID=1801832 RepID=A0A1G1L3U2_9BACT|nr:MAG: tRNA (N(6)-L-threonylcarbamoyladenosine(37)-C(2))-methylthiotransferase MtaB [Omnitrophica bacterium RIFCSPHIGHO2_02_FULL_45_28]OGW99539.1 MAG: tRNA (N(6)-L-threonylcarbamoyladenosine(37)-C(2))-methylthiotransferase MtaB [Omnitrophica bacterium RIFCSPLOWO2_12_FULL_44_17]OGX02712.1 MAG: tRNA (N(6)-L-threonylcarbamoyladenosine(37)-C(2))-methylthiotransferase MtaB [Omnitrophica bacterium RIFCSPLOWO2_02_FULL_44_11]
MRESSEQGGRKVKFLTLGCRVNQYETQAIREQFLRQKYEETESAQSADFVVINTCTVTHESDRQSRYLIRKTYRENPKAKIVVTGCWADGDSETAEKLEGVYRIVSNSDKPDFLRELSVGENPPDEKTKINSKWCFPCLNISQFKGRTRAYVKIQDGCNHACSFCKVVLVRGPSRSRPMRDVIEETKRLCDFGIREIVLTGVQLGAYGYDLEKRQILPDLIGELVRIPDLKRIRLSSIEPTDVSKDLIGMMAQSEKICHHLHIPLQSGDDEVLKRMNRRYDSRFFENLIDQIRFKLSDFILTADVIFGFPGEDVDRFDRTISLLKQVKPYKTHIFPYSRREGTRAFRYTEKIPPAELRERKQKLFEMDQTLRNEVCAQYVEKKIEILIEDREAASENGSIGRTDNYLEVFCRNKVISPGSFVKVRIDDVENGILIAHLNQEDRYGP